MLQLCGLVLQIWDFFFFFKNTLSLVIHILIINKVSHTFGTIVIIWLIGKDLKKYIFYRSLSQKEKIQAEETLDN